MKFGRTKFTSLAEIQAHQYVGNHYSDCEAIRGVTDFARDTNNSLHDRAEALRDMSDRAMGMPTPDTTDEEMIASLDA